ncbi:MAG: TRAP transporter substrate-binding protein DctP [Pseudomonadota bacterium]
MKSTFATVLAVLALFATAGAQAQTLKIATIAPEGSQWVKDMRDGARQIRERTDSRVQMKIYAGGVMGADNKVLRKIRIGQLHGAYFTATALQDRYADVNVYGMPFLFRSEDEVRYVRERLDVRLTDGLREAGFESFGFSGGGFARLMSNTPVSSLEDLTRQKVWVPEGDTISYRAMEAMGLSPVTLPLTDVLTGLQSGLIDIIGSPPVAALVLQWHTKVKYVTELPLVYTMGFLAIDRKAFGRLSPADRAVVADVLSAVSAKVDRDNRKDSGAALAALENSGLTFVSPDPAAVEAWRARMLEANLDMASDGLVSEDLLDDVLALLAEYRAEASLASRDGTGAR